MCRSIVTGTTEWDYGSLLVATMAEGYAVSVRDLKGVQLLSRHYELTRRPVWRLVNMETEKRKAVQRKAVPFRCPTCGSEAIFCDSDAEGSLPWIFCDVCRKYGGRPKSFWCPECGSQDFLDYTELGKNDQGLLHCSACRKTGTQWEFAQRPRPWRHWRYWKTRIDMRSLVVAAGTIVTLHLSVSHGAAQFIFGHTIPEIMMGIMFYFVLSQTFDDRR